MPINVLTGPVIEEGMSLSKPLTVSAGAVFRLIMPSEWTAAPLTFQISYDGLYFYDVYDLNGKEITIPVIPNSIVAFGEYLLYIQQLRIRSGTAQSPVIQPEERIFRVVLDTKGLAVAFEETDNVQTTPQKGPA